MLKDAAAFIMGFLANKVYEDKKNLVKHKQMNNLIVRQEEALKTYEKWVDTIHENKMISQYLLENDYKSVAIYGLGRLGKQIYKEILPTKVKVEYIIDQKYSLVNPFFEQTRCYNPEEEFPAADLIIVTVSGEAEAISAKLRTKVSCPVKTINELLFVLD